MQVTDATDFHFDGWTLRTRSGELVRDGNSQRLPQQPLRVLVELLSHPGDVVTRERLVEVLWPKGIVDFDNSLNAVVRKLRVVLGDDSDAPRYIETLPRIGYRFVGKMDSPAQAAPAPSADVATPQPRRVTHRHWVVMALAAVTGAAVLAWWLRGPKPLPADIPATESAEPRRASSQRAYELYLAGKFHRSRRDISGSDPAIESFRAALQEDPHFADAWAALAETYVGAGITQRMPVLVAFEEARRAALRAVELQPDLASGHAALGVVMLHFDHDFEGAERELLKARTLDTGYARAWHSLGLLRGYQGRIEEALEYVGRAREIEPTQLLYAANYGNLLYQSRRYEEAIAVLRPLIASQPRFDQARGILIRTLLASGDVHGALEQLTLRHSDVPLLSDAGVAYALAGRRDEALRQVGRLERRGAEGYAMSFELAVLHAALGQMDQACAALRRAADDHSQTIGWLKLDPRMDPMRKEACYAEVERKLFKEKGPDS